jgi:hypothetical protein
MSGVRNWWGEYGSKWSIEYFSNIVLLTIVWNDCIVNIKKVQLNLCHCACHSRVSMICLCG